ncbi:hypothetical protein [uncultured Flavobacterium sp.]|uniref:hypothetical protein n=1 Tax=uncultured Flavobacterium sp. TaxID=165435 RepID=UPI0025E872F8|nr:hypothetical protein [uncultured Flavobacterium sp.]
MKKLFSILLPLAALGFLFSCSADSAESQEELQNTTTADSPRADPGGNVTWIWTYGRKSRSCHGFGICKTEKVKVKIEPLPEVTIIGASSARASAPAPDQLHLEFDESDTRSIINGYGGTVLLIEEDFEMEREITSTIGLRSGFVIRAGRYPLRFNAATGLNEVFIR